MDDGRSLRSPDRAGIRQVSWGLACGRAPKGAKV